MAITRAVVDTGPLITVLTLNYVQIIGATQEKRSSVLRKIVSGEVLRIPRFEERYVELFNTIRAVLMTSHVVGELQGLEVSRLKLGGQDLRSFWLSSMEFLTRKNVDGRLLRLVAMHQTQELREAVCVVGPTDTGLIDLARKEGCVLLTDDRRTLAPLAWRIGVDCQLVEPLISS